MNPTKKAGLKIQDSKDLLVEYIVAKQIDLQPVLSEYNFQQKKIFLRRYRIPFKLFSGIIKT